MRQLPAQGAAVQVTRDSGDDAAEAPVGGGSVADRDATVARVAELDGTVHMAAADIPGIAGFAALAGPLGASFSVMKPARR